MSGRNAYAIAHGFVLRGVKPLAEVPYAVEAWVRPTTGDPTSVLA